VRLPVGAARAAHLHTDQPVRVEVGKGRVIIIPPENVQPTLEHCLERFGPARHTTAVGAEQG